MKGFNDFFTQIENDIIIDKFSITWSDDMLAYYINPLRLTPIYDQPITTNDVVYVYYDETTGYFSVDDFSNNIPMKHRQPTEVFLFKTTEILSKIFTNLIFARAWNYRRKLTLNEVVAEWNYLAYIISFMRGDPNLLKRIGKPTFDEYRIIEANINIGSDIYAENERMHVSSLFPQFEEKQKNDNSNPLSKYKPSIIELFDTKTVTQSNQWFAIYKVLSQLCNFNDNMSAFCTQIEELKLDVKPQCVYNNWKNVSSNQDSLPSDVNAWTIDESKATKAKKMQITIAVKLIGILKKNGLIE